ncbi:MAG: hypothetical protein OXD29_13805 [Roseovarius sp.]|nr:hypothetical protein [Roseovarius sp.]
MINVTKNNSINYISMYAEENADLGEIFFESKDDADEIFNCIKGIIECVIKFYSVNLTARSWGDYLEGEINANYKKIESFEFIQILLILFLEIKK